MTLLRHLEEAGFAAAPRPGFPGGSVRAVYRHQITDEITSAATAMDAIFGDASGS